MKSVVCVHLYNDRSGSPKVLLQTIRALHAAGVEVETLTSDHEGGFLDEVPGKKSVLFYRRSDNRLLTLLYYLFSQLFLFFRCLGYLRKDVVFHVNTLMPCGAALAGWLMRKPVIYHVHETSIHPLLLKRILRGVVRLTAHRVIFVSHYLQQSDGFPEKTTFTIYNAVDTWPDGVEATFPQGRFNVLMVCSLKSYKGVDEFVALAKACDDAGMACDFTLVLNADQGELDRYFSGTQRPNNLTTCTRQSDLSDFYAKADLLLNLTRPDECVETFGLTVLEGMANGLPVIVPPVGGPAELVDNGVQGYHFSCYQIDEIKRCIENLMDNPGVYRDLSSNARLRAAEFVPERFEQQVVDFYNREVFA